MNDQSMQSFGDRARTVRLDARPEPIEFIPNQTAIVVVDLQNGYASPGGYRELIGQDVGPARGAVANALRILDAARAADRIRPTGTNRTRSRPCGRGPS